MIEMTQRYHHTQVGYLTLTVGIVLMAVGLYGLRVTMAGGLIWLAAGLVLVLLFGCLTVTVRDHVVEIRFGIGLIRKRYPLGQFLEVRVVRNKWYYGWGIRWWPGTILFNVSGLDAVELRRPDGSAVRIGTDEPEALKRALDRLRGGT